MTFPRVDALGLADLLVRFGDRFDPATNRAAIAYRAAVEADRSRFEGLVETASTLAGVHLVFDPLQAEPPAARAAAEALLAEADWTAADDPAHAREWTLAARFGEPEAAFDETAAAAGLEPDALRLCLERLTLRVLTIGFAPGQPYLGPIPDLAGLQRRRDLIARVPPGTLAVAVGQMVLFTTESATGWHPVGRTGFKAFAPDAAEPFPLRPGDRVRFAAA